VDRAIEVVKVGGSLLDWPELPGRLRGVLDARRSWRHVLIAGGGRAADVVRALDRAHGLGEGPSHALALRALDFTAHALAAVVPGLAVATRFEELDASWRRDRVPVLAPRPELDADDGSPDALPHAWDVTSDSIAARVSVLLGAASLLLLKSAPLPPGCDRAGAARLGLVDPAFEAASRGLASVGYLDLRGGGIEPTPLSDGDAPA
jgi:aspartokinase-like uncharacterized kinase